MPITKWSGKAHEERKSPVGFDFCRRRSSGFTVLELLIVIGIIALLVTLFFVAFKHVSSSNRTKDTKTTMETAQSIFSAYDQATHLAKVPAGLIANYWTAGVEIAPSNSNPSLNLGLSVDVLQLTTPNHPVPPAILQDTESVMPALTSLPDSQKLMSNLPSAKIVMEQARTGDPVGKTYPPMLLDSWGAPIFFIPGNGLLNVKASEADNYNSSTNYVRGNRIIFGGVFYTCLQATTNTPPSTSPNNIGIIWGGICSPDFRPFWASAGPDGDLSRGDDNIYSFEQ